MPASSGRHQVPGLSREEFIREMAIFYFERDRDLASDQSICEPGGELPCLRARSCPYLKLPTWPAVGEIPGETTPKGSTSASAGVSSDLK